MIWFLVVAGILLVLLGVWGGPRRRRRPEKASRIPKDATVQEAWDILTAPVEYDEEVIKIPDHKPWFVPSGDRRFHQGLAVGLGLGLVVAALVLPFVPRGEAPQPDLPEAPKVAETPDPVGTATPPVTPPPTQEQAPDQTQPAAPPPKPVNVTFVVEPGSPSQVIAANLKAAGLIADEQAFLDLVFALGVETRLKAGTFVIPTDASLDAVIKVLTE